MKVKYYNLSQFMEFDSAYWGMGVMQNNLIYFALCTHQPGKSAALFSFDPITKNVIEIATVTKMLNSEKPSAIQGKIHTPLFEGSDNRLYFGTHFSYPFGIPQKIIYEGGHLIAYTPKTNTFDDLGIPHKGEGIVTMTFDKKRMRAYMLMAPSGRFITYDVAKKTFKDFGTVMQKGSICRSLVVDDAGNVFGSFEPNGIFIYNVHEDSIKKLSLTLPDTTKPVAEWSSPSRGGVNRIGRKLWRCALWDTVTKTIFAVHASSSEILQIDIKKEKITSKGFFAVNTFINKPETIYPTLSLAHHGNTIFYAPATGFFDYARSEKIEKGTHLLTYNIENQKVTDHGKMNDNNHNVYGVGGAIASSNNHVYFLGTVEKKASDSYNTHYSIDNKGFYLTLIEVTI